MRTITWRACALAVLMGAGTFCPAAVDALRPEPVIVAASAYDVVRFFGTNKVGIFFYLDSVGAGAGIGQFFHLDYSRSAGMQEPAIAKVPASRTGRLPADRADAGAMTFFESVRSDSTKSRFVLSVSSLRRGRKKESGFEQDGRPGNEQMYAVDLRDSARLKVLQIVDSAVTFAHERLQASLWVDPAPDPEDSRARLARAIHDDSRIRSGRSAAFEQDGVRIDKETITSASPLVEVSLHTVLGACLHVRRILGYTTSASLSQLFPGTERGVYFVKVTTDTGVQSVIRWIL